MRDNVPHPRMTFDQKRCGVPVGPRHLALSSHKTTGCIRAPFGRRYRFFQPCGTIASSPAWSQYVKVEASFFLPYPWTGRLVADHNGCTNPREILLKQLAFVDAAEPSVRRRGRAFLLGAPPVGARGRSLKSFPYILRCHPRIFVRG